MIKGLTTAGLGELSSNEEYIRLASQFGFQSIDANPLELIQQYGKEGAVQLLASHGIMLGSFGLEVDWRTTEESFREGLQSLTRMAEAAAALKCTTCCTYILPSTDLPVAPFMIAATRRLKLCAEILGAYGITLALEFVGPHHLRTMGESSDLDDAGYIKLDGNDSCEEHWVAAGFLPLAYEWINE